MKSYYDHFRVKPGSKVRLRDIDPDSTGGLDKSAASRLEDYTRRLRELQELLYAEHKRSLLICLQAMDAGGKDGTIRHVLAAMNPQGCRVHSFKKPAGAELDHEFMWRAYNNIPAKGEVAIFNRSYYEDVLVSRVHKLVPETALSKRYDDINHFEQHWSNNSIHILKFFLHISKEEQLKRFKDRLDDKTKQWKISESDYTEREYWDDYAEAFELMLSRCSTEDAPWFIIPANHKWFRDLAIAQIVVEHLEKLGMTYPAPAVDLDKMRQQYHKAKKNK